MSMQDAVYRFLTSRRHTATAFHCQRVAVQASDLAQRFGVDTEKAHLAGLLHDISAVIPNAERLARAEAWGIAILPEERAAPMILHQKLSAVLAQRQFSIEDATVLSAIGCHTTLKADASGLDKVVFVADKIAWDQPGTPPWLDALTRALDVSLDAAALVYLDYLWERRAQLLVVHPWFVAARAQRVIKMHIRYIPARKLGVAFDKPTSGSEAGASWSPNVVPIVGIGHQKI